MRDLHRTPTDLSGFAAMSLPDAKPPLPQTLKGRGSVSNPANRFDRMHVADDPDWLDEETGAERLARKIPTEYFMDHSQSIVTHNESPDLPFSYSLNPYRGCEHGCTYCYARPYHEYLGLSCGLDFETKIFVKPDAPALLEEWLMRPKWQPEPIAMSGVTDCYQPVERKLRIARGCLEVCARFGQPIGTITKNALITRDLDVLKDLASGNLVHTTLSITTLDPRLARAMEPRASGPDKRFAAVEALAKAGVRVGVNLAPIVPGLTDHEIPALLERARDAGAGSAGYIMLRLPLQVKDLFMEWVEREFPDRAAKVRHAIEGVRDGKLNATEWGTRMRGTGWRADLIEQVFRSTRDRLGLTQRWLPLATDKFHRPAGAQQVLF
jgi:DNA repair photolyase